MKIYKTLAGGYVGIDTAKGFNVQISKDAQTGGFTFVQSVTSIDEAQQLIDAFKNMNLQELDLATTGYTAEQLDAIFDANAALVSLIN